jgi:hypothetical protein
VLTAQKPLDDLKELASKVPVSVSEKRKKAIIQYNNFLETALLCSLLPFNLKRAGGVKISNSKFQKKNVFEIKIKIKN